MIFQTNATRPIIKAARVNIAEAMFIFLDLNISKCVMRLKPSGRDLRLDSRKRGDGVATP